MKILKAEHNKDNPYTIISRRTVWDRRIFGDALCVLLLIISRREQDFSLQWLKQATGLDDYELGRALVKLKRTGYLIMPPDNEDNIFIEDPMALQEEVQETNSIEDKDIKPQPQVVQLPVTNLTKENIK